MNSSYGLVISWNNVNNVRVTIRGRYLNKTSGLCGTYNGIKSDDFLMSNNTIHTDATAFGNSWKTDPSCEDAITVEHPCVTYPDRESTARHNCSALLGPPFWLCNETVDATDGYVANCEYDMCACEINPVKCLCESFQAYAAECNSRGVAISWKNESGFEKCSKYATK